MSAWNLKLPSKKSEKTKQKRISYLFDSVMSEIEAGPNYNS